MTDPKQPSGRDLKAKLTGTNASAQPTPATPAAHEQGRLAEWLGKPTEPMTADEVFETLFRNSKP